MKITDKDNPPDGLAEALFHAAWPSKERGDWRHLPSMSKDHWRRVASLSHRYALSLARKACEHLWDKATGSALDEDEIREYIDNALQSAAPNFAVPDDGASRIAKERQRQVEKEGWSASHDAEHDQGEMAMAAACYATPIPIRGEMRIPRPCGCRSANECFHNLDGGAPEWVDPWPWDPKYDKREKHSRIRSLEVAGALVAAEIDRLLAAEGQGGV